MPACGRELQEALNLADEPQACAVARYLLKVENEADFGKGHPELGPSQIA
jgi:hypothetical protein